MEPIPRRKDLRKRKNRVRGEWGEAPCKEREGLSYGAKNGEYATALSKSGKKKLTSKESEWLRAAKNHRKGGNTSA